MALRSGIVTLTTDFGTRDAYVGAMKGVVCRILPSVRLVDLSHEIPPQDVRDAAPGEALALTGGDGRIEIAVHGGSAAERFGLARGHRIEVRRCAGTGRGGT